MVRGAGVRPLTDELVGPAENSGGFRFFSSCFLSLFIAPKTGSFTHVSRDYRQQKLYTVDCCPAISLLEPTQGRRSWVTSVTRLWEEPMIRIPRRKFLKITTASAAAVRVGGIAGILASGRAPALCPSSNRALAALGRLRPRL
jgi:hypothetical protein